MPTQTIPPENWETFLNRFSSDHEGWPVSLEVDDAPVKDLVEAHDLALEGITADQKDGENAIVISVGRDDNKRLDHEVVAPTRITLERTSDGADKELLINSASGTTVVRLRAPIKTDTPI